MSKFIYQMCTFQMFTSIEKSFSTEYKFDRFYTSEKKAIKATYEYVEWLADEYSEIKVTPFKFEQEKGLYSILALVENGEKKEYYGVKRHYVNI